MSRTTDHSSPRLEAAEVYSASVPMHELLEAIPGAAIVFDTSLRILASNLNAKLIWPDVQGDLGELLYRSVVESEFEDWSEELRGVLKTGRPRQSDVMLAPATGGDASPVSLSVRAIRSVQSGEVTGGLLLADNVTDSADSGRQRAINEKLAAVGKLAARVAHELNNPLDGILRYTNLARRMVNADAMADAKLRDYLDKTRDGILRMRDILATLLDFSRSAPGIGEQATINKIIEDALSAMEGRSSAAGVTVVCNFHRTDLPVVRGSGLFQIVCNLAKNAIDAMPDGGTLTVTARLEENDVVIIVEDTGTGLPENVERIFEPFYTTKPVGQGTGLGLAVCRELIEQYDGTLTAERRDPKGTRMTIRAPIKGLAQPMIQRGQSEPRA